jgi:hypothetical protein
MISALMPAIGRAGQVVRFARQPWLFPTLVVVAGGLIAACKSSTGGNDPQPGVPDALELLTGVPATSQTRTAFAPSPVVQVVDAFGDPVAQAGISVAAAIQTGGGAISGTAAVATDANGQATFSNLRINGLVGNRTMRFTASGLTGITSGTVTITAGPAATIVANSTTSQSALVGQPVSVPPSVKVTDLDNNPIAGVAVTFAITSGNGSMTGGAQVTNTAGIATVSSWTVDANPGANTMTATAAGLTGSPVTFSATGGNTISSFTIDLVYIFTPSAAAQAAFDAAKARWEQVITGDLADVTLSSPIDIGPCTSTGGTLNASGTIDDVRIYVELKAEDGAGGILAAAGPCVLRTSGTRLTMIGTMFFDTADLPSLIANNELTDVVTHEMGHVLGYGTLWEPIAGLWPTNFLNGAGTADPTFLGSGAINAYANLNGGAGNVPVEGTGGPGTADSHWRETIFQSELMTGFISGTVRPLSATSVRSIEDLGYVVDLNAADPFNIATQPTLRDDRNARVLHLKDDVRRGPIFYYHEGSGRLIRKR